MSILCNKQRNSSHLKETNSNNNNNKKSTKNTNQTKTNNHYNNIRNRSTTHEQNPSNEMIISKQMISFLQLTKEKSPINENQPKNNDKKN